MKPSKIYPPNERNLDAMRFIDTHCPNKNCIFYVAILTLQYDIRRGGVHHKNGLKAYRETHVIFLENEAIKRDKSPDAQKARQIFQGRLMIWNALKTGAKNKAKTDQLYKF